MSILEQRSAASPPLADLWRLIRPHQWVKNLLAVPIALVDAPGGPTLSMAARAGWAVLLFTVASAIVYIVNDISDRERDRAHPVKRQRPIASGRVPVALAAGFAMLLAIGLGAALVLGPGLRSWPLIAYLLLNLAYSRWLRHVGLLDVNVVAIGFVLRVLFGYTIMGIAISPWLLIAVYLLCLLLILGKRRHEVRTFGIRHRVALRDYSVQYLDYLIVLSAVMAFTTFMLYLTEAVFAAPYNEAALLISAPCALFALARFIQMVVVQQEGDDPVRVLLRDHRMLAVGCTWLALLGLTSLMAHHQAMLQGVLGQGVLS